MILKQIKKILESNINIYFFSIHDDSTSHNHSKNHLTHLQLIIISNDFIEKNWISRHRMIFSILKNNMKKQIYSITLHTYTVMEWKNKKKINLNEVKCIRKNIHHNTINNI